MLSQQREKLTRHAAFQPPYGSWRSCDSTVGLLAGAVGRQFEPQCLLRIADRACRAWPSCLGSGSLVGAPTEG